jgi:hypothetical protein
MDQLYITVLYMNFYEFWKKLKFSLKIHVLAYDFSENHQFGAKTDRNSVFLDRDPHIAGSVIHNSHVWVFIGFKKTQIFAQNHRC